MRRLRMSVLAPLLLVLLAAGGDGDEEVATEREGVPTAPPTTLAALPDDIGEATVEIASGAFGVEELTLQENEPTLLHVVNNDDRAYRFRIVEDLVTATAIAPRATTDVGFTTPRANVYEGQLLPAAGEEVLDAVRVVVLGPGGVEP